ncbi:MAG: bifunctional (p)ppGpp synthetase/guanosine-3',5'-bis(diphosphate) 3'-pyrophosphohydrolase [Lachnospiraceae bacterium]|nr:bifunctional (p)ppGpp synthetase/guanosine-3',5'-bis(diphosphate) 3'-pyrophosphohydrolase [Lachnospiraceae bacterium]
MKEFNEKEADYIDVEGDQLESFELVRTEDFETPSSIYARLTDKVKEYHPSDDVTQIDKAYRLAEKAHADQMRKSGEPYIIHPLCVALILADLELDKETIIAALLHDAAEDTDVTMEEIEEQFGKEVASLVDGVTKLGQVSYISDKVEMQAENLRKMFLAMAKDIRVILIKLADRLHNMRTLKYMTPQKQKEKARETIDIYSPIARRLGISRLKVELDDLSLRYLEPEVYFDLAEKISATKAERESYVRRLMVDVEKVMMDGEIDCEISGRVKHFFSIYRKMVNQGKTLDEIYDLFALRIVVENIKDCYAALGLIHEKYTPVPGRFKDYIAMPKDNMYQSLHTTLMGPGGRPFEIQIRTKEMHKIAEYGIAAHWKYKEAPGEKNIENKEEAKLTWLRQILEWQTDMSDNAEFMNLIRNDLNLFSDDVYCFTPAGDIKNLPAGSTPIDFAYAIHSAVGNRMVGARVNGRIERLDYKLKNGDRVEVITSQNSRGPSRDWLGIVKSAQARSKINQWFKSENKEENIEKGREMIHDYCKAKSIPVNEILIPEYMDKVRQKYGFRDWDAVCAAIGHGGLKEGQVINKMVDLYTRDKKKVITDEDILAENSVRHTTNRQKNKNGIIIKGMTDVAAHLSRCCNPVPGDEIIGFITRGRGVSVHRTDCVNIINVSPAEKFRLIEAEWESSGENSDDMYTADIRVYVYNRVGALVSVARVFTENDINILSMTTNATKGERASIDMSFDVKDRAELTKIMDKLRQVDMVIDIKRSKG